MSRIRSSQRKTHLSGDDDAWPGADDDDDGPAPGVYVRGTYKPRPRSRSPRRSSDGDQPATASRASAVLDAAQAGFRQAMGRSAVLGAAAETQSSRNSAAVKQSSMSRAAASMSRAAAAAAAVKQSYGIQPQSWQQPQGSSWSEPAMDHERKFLKDQGQFDPAKAHWSDQDWKDHERRFLKPNGDFVKKRSGWWDKKNDGTWYEGVIDDCGIPSRERGKIMGDGGSNMRIIIEAICKEALGIDYETDWQKVFVCDNSMSGEMHFKLEVYEPFNNKASFDRCARVFRKTIREIRQNPHSGPRHCFRPKKVQPDDWDCPNPACGNLCFSRRRECNMCKTPRPSIQDRMLPTISDVPMSVANPGIPKMPKHRIEMVSRLDSLGPAPAGKVQPILLIPVSVLGSVIGRGGSAIKAVQEESGAQLWLTAVTEVRRIADADYVMAIIRGSSDQCSSAVRLLKESTDEALLAADGFEALLDACESALRSTPQSRSPSQQLLDRRDICDASTDVRDLMAAVGCFDAADLMEQFPARFTVQRDLDMIQLTEHAASSKADEQWTL